MVQVVAERHDGKTFVRVGGFIRGHVGRCIVECPCRDEEPVVGVLLEGEGWEFGVDGGPVPVEFSLLFVEEGCACWGEEELEGDRPEERHAGFEGEEGWEG